MDFGPHGLLVGLAVVGVGHDEGVGAAVGPGPDCGEQPGQRVISPLVSSRSSPAAILAWAVGVALVSDAGPQDGMCCVKAHDHGQAELRNEANP